MKAAGALTASPAATGDGRRSSAAPRAHLTLLCVLAASVGACAGTGTAAGWRFHATADGAGLTTGAPGARVALSCLRGQGLLLLEAEPFARTPGLESLVMRAGEAMVEFPLPVTSGGPVRGRAPLDPQTARSLAVQSPVSIQHGKQAAWSPPLPPEAVERLLEACSAT